MIFWVHDTKLEGIEPTQGSILARLISEEQRNGGDYQTVSPKQKLYEVEVSNSQHYEKGDIIIPMLQGFKLEDDAGDTYFIVDEGRILARLKKV